MGRYIFSPLFHTHWAMHCLSLPFICIMMLLASLANLYIARLFHCLSASIMKEHLKDPTIIADNNVTGAHGEMTLTDLCQWIDVNNPVISGNATFYLSSI